MQLRKIMFSLILILTIAASCEVIAQEKITTLEMINKSPKCYALTEIINLYSKGDNDNFEYFYINFSNATKIQSYPQDAGNAIPLIFNEFSRKFRNAVIKTIIESGYNQKALSDIYDNIGCSVLAKKINDENIILDTKN